MRTCFLFVFLSNPILLYLYLKFVHICIITCTLWYLVLLEGKLWIQTFLQFLYHCFIFVFKINPSGLIQIPLQLYKEIKFCTYIIKNHIFNIYSPVSAIFSMLPTIVALKVEILFFTLSPTIIFFFFFLIYLE